MENQIYSLIPACMEDIKAIGKDSKNTQQGYQFRGIDAVYNALQPVLSKHKVFAVPEVLEQRREDVTNKNGTQLHYSILTVRYHFYAPDGSSVATTVIGEGMDAGDKASNKAMSVAFKYACFQVFCIPTDEMVDPDRESPEGRRNPQTGGDKKPGKSAESSTKKPSDESSDLPPPTPKPSESARQQEVRKLSKEAKISIKDVVTFMQDNYQKSKVDDLDENEYDLLCGWLMQERK